jgi:nucleotide-binding universal stress UspA family protein
MEQAMIFDTPFVNSVFHPSDFSPASENAFTHALAIALMRRTAFTILHTDASEQDWTRSPAVRTTLERWGMLEPGSPRSAVFEQLAVRVNKIGLKSDSPLQAILDYLHTHPTDLIVLATEGRSGLPRWLQRSVAERLAERSGTMTLFVPDGARGFVSRDDGTVSLRRILLPVDKHPGPLPAIEYAARIASALGTPIEIILLHVGAAATLPASMMPPLPTLTWTQENRQGDVVDELIGAANDHQVDLIAMTTAGQEGILDTLRGSVTQQVLRRAPCPLLAVPRKTGAR